MQHQIPSFDRKYWPMAGFIALFAIVGTILLFSSRAASPNVSIDARSGTAANGAGAKSCAGSNATNNQCVVFGSSGGSGNTGVPWIGLNDFTGWGPPLTKQYIDDGFRWARIDETGSGYSPGNAVDSALGPGCGDGVSTDPGCNVLIIVPSSTSGAMSWMNAYKSYGSRVIYEYTNEPFYNGVSASTYAQGYQAAYNAKHAAGITQPLLFMTTGDPFNQYGGKLWLDEALLAVPNLQIDGFSSHPYGEANADVNQHSNGVNGLLYEHQNAVNNGFANAPWYVTEFGFTLCQPVTGGCTTTSSTSSTWYVPNYAQQAAQLTAAYNQMIAYGDGTSGTWLQGIMWYQTHDDGTGWFGLLTSPTPASLDNAGEPAGNDTSKANTPIVLRPSYTALKAFLTNH